MEVERETPRVLIVLTEKGLVKVYGDEWPKCSVAIVYRKPSETDAEFWKRLPEMFKPIFVKRNYRLCGSATERTHE